MKFTGMLVLAVAMSSAAFAQGFDYRAQAKKRIQATALCAIDYLGGSNDVLLTLDMALPSGHVSHEEFTQVANECNSIMKETARKFFDERVVRVSRAARITGVHAADGRLHRQFVLSPSVTVYVDVEWILPGLRQVHVGQTFKVGLSGRALEIYLVQKGLGQWTQGRRGEWYLVLSPNGAKQLERLAGEAKQVEVVSTQQGLAEWSKAPTMDYLQEIAKIWKSKF